MSSVPFENLDITLGRPIELSLPSLFEKIVGRRRGGFCYELNGLFAWLLEQIGFQVTVLSGRVFNAGVLGPEFDHMLLLLEMLDMDERMIADVGFGDSFIEPIPLDVDVQAQHGSSYRLVREDGHWLLHKRNAASDWEAQYAFSLTPRLLDDFREMCHYQQTSRDSPFTRKSVCSRATRDGRVTLSNGRRIVTSSGQREERPVATAREYESLLWEDLGIDFGGEVDVALLMRPNTAA